MYGSIWELDDYFTEQMRDNPQLFETNLLERFPLATGYVVYQTDNGVTKLMIQQEGDYEDQFIH